MSRKDYILLANALKSATPPARDGDAAMQTWHRAVMQVANSLESDNSRFNRARFVVAATGAEV
jgi:hypothetical protein